MDEAAPPELGMFELTFDGLVRARLCFVAAKLRLADLIGDSPRSSDELAAETRMDERSLYRVLRAAIVPPPGVPGHSRLDDVEMMIVLCSQMRTEEEYAALFAASGFRPARVVPATMLVSVLEATPV